MTDPGVARDPYLVGLDLRGRRVVLVGAGTVVQRRLPPLLAAGADVHVIAPEATPAVESTVGITWHRREYADGDLAGAWYALAATDDPAVNARVVAEAQAQRTFCVRADLAREGTAVTPATVATDGLQVGVLAAGDHRRSAAVRNALGAVLTGDEAARPTRKPEGVALVGGGPGDPDLITVRGRALLAVADVVVADRLAPPRLLAELAPHVEVIDAAKVPYGRAMAQQAINQVLIDRAREGKFVVRLKGGDPYVFGRGYEELEALAAEGIPVTVVPGITSSIAAPSAAGIPVTHRGVTHEFVVVSGHVAPGHPDSLVDWDALGRLRGTVVVLMAVERLGVIAEALIAGGRPSDTPAAVVESATTGGQRTVRGTLTTIAADSAAAEVAPPAVLVVGPVAGFTQSDESEKPSAG
ncbi:uroporphyrinogen-III C-methyltransferase OS=Tsukamurella paurometabola (strain ATCC 8368 / DSM/ CCUG 35730 / CIP 100753 / JCM 10117 / KCTC 9821 / NBRC 16120 / NCIMB 702349 / NCTC 13040) OX=521096 GN=Tpau_1703 PE=3 SV=1 [Tsukamurella paurometabola]|uniref:uroporphyrinogen-III C-methyltransferase n=1 Tax=Tsukamurella paurometabola (strain ATCC 8368 / DSM 20162 / CCUG 35730 / CIP 100753 / JCM 10117 / KCTC 9821 / NBRC 16120 / NCIMB 702349 / NCTC 13040) TaxID=521096 RepID=D5UM41_TSUPD|nr:uroporphyrinogen-III C-methyltransferase [Tsukamurella paurometabola]ADG78321.1 uroporphyrin-III C-methyltransferase [Tsukamurella paurometabola DSM 20162]SUP31197.1 Siroheme synthase [Tsukamurella paurometabola]